MPEVHEAIRSYHISFSKERAKSPIKKPRHMVLYFTVSKDNSLVVSRILYDAMEPTRDMVDEHKKMMEKADLEASIKHLKKRDREQER